MNPSAPSILIVKLSSMGDLFHALPAVHALKDGLRGEVDWVAQQEYVELVRCFTDVSDVIAFPRRAFVKHAAQLRRELRRKRYDYVIDLQGLMKSAVVTALSRGARKIGPSYYREGARLAYRETAGKRDTSRHAVEQCRDVVRHLGLAVGQPIFPVKFPDVPMDGGGRRVALIPVSRWPSKNWPMRHFVELARQLSLQGGVSLFLLGGAADAGVCATIEQALGQGGARNLAGRFSLPELGGVLKGMDLVISNDSGPVHMAVAAGTRTLALFGPTDPARTGPYGLAHRVLRAPPPCFACYDRHCRRHGESCMANLAPGRVLQAAQEMLTTVAKQRH